MRKTGSSGLHTLQTEDDIDRGRQHRATTPQGMGSLRINVAWGGWGAPA